MWDESKSRKRCNSLLNLDCSWNHIEEKGRRTNENRKKEFSRLSCDHHLIFLHTHSLLLRIQHTRKRIHRNDFQEETHPQCSKEGRRGLFEFPSF